MRIRSMLKSGSGSALPSGSCRTLVPVTLVSHGLIKMATSVNLEWHATTGPESEAANRNYRVLIPRNAESLIHGLGRETRGNHQPFNF